MSFPTWTGFTIQCGTFMLDARPSYNSFLTKQTAQRRNEGTLTAPLRRRSPVRYQSRGIVIHPIEFITLNDIKRSDDRLVRHPGGVVNVMGPMLSLPCDAARCLRGLMRVVKRLVRSLAILQQSCLPTPVCGSASTEAPTGPIKAPRLRGMLQDFNFCWLSRSTAVIDVIFPDQWRHETGFVARSQISAHPT